MYVKHTRLTKVAKLASLVITVFNWEKAGQWRHSRMRTIGECRNSAFPVVTNKRVSRKTPTAHSEDTCEEVGWKKLYKISACIQLMKESECASVL